MPLMRGAIPTSRHRLLGVTPFKQVGAIPEWVAYVPKRLSMWGNDQYGDCVTAEEAFAKATAAPEIFIEDREVIDWARRHGWLNGAELTPVMDAMARGGFNQDHHVYGDGPYKGVDYGDETLLRNAIAVGPVKIGIDADALPGGAGNQSGWFALGTGRQYRNEDHCVALCGYGTVGQLYAAMGLAPPPSVPAVLPGYLLYTWNTIGFVDHAWVMSTCGEAYVRNPTNLIDGKPVEPPAPPPPPPPPPPIPTGLPTRAEFDALVALVRPQLPDGPALARPMLGANWQQILIQILTLILQLLQPQPACQNVR